MNHHQEKNIVVIGFGGLAKETLLVIKKNPEWNFLGFVTHEKNNDPIIFTDEELLNYPEKIYAAIGIGDPNLRGKIYIKFKQNPNIIFPNIIHPHAEIDLNVVKLGEGNIICAGSIFTTDIQIGNNNYFNLAITCGHDTKIGNSNVINPSVNISGGIELGSNILVGTGAKILQYLKVEDHATIGAGAVVTKNVAANETVIGIPAKPLKKH